MKKIFSILFAGFLGLMATSCIQEQLATFDMSKAEAPVLVSPEFGTKGITVSYTPGDFQMGFNGSMAPAHVLALVSVNGNEVSKIVTSTDDGTSLKTTFVNISKALAFLGYKDGDIIPTVELAVRATMQSLSQDNGVNGYVDSKERIELYDFQVTLPVGSPYADYTESTPWSVIGALSNYDINWNGDLEMFATSDGKHLVAKAVKLAKGDQFKFRKDQDWTDNYGAAGDADPTVVTLDSDLAGAAGGKNMAVPSEGTYDLWLDLSGPEAVITVTDAYLPYPGFSQATTWSVIGALSNYGINWNGDLAMTSDGTSVLAQGIKLSKDDQFKFRKDGSWDVNFGASGDADPTVVSLGSESPAAAGGKNLAVPADGVYDLLLNPDAKTFTVVETLGGGVSGKIGGSEPEPEPEPQPVTGGWAVIGDFNGWGADAAMTQVAPGIWISDVLELTDAGWKLRYNGSWDVNRGGATPAAIGEFVAAYPGGDDIKFTCKGRVVFNENNQTIGILGWGVVGSIAGIEGFNWNNDIPMNLAGDGKWYSVPVALGADDAIKIRYMADWADDRGGDAAAADEAFAVTKGGSNIKAPKAGTYMVVYDPASEKITLSTDFWGLIGEFNSWNGDRFLLPAGNGKWSAFNQEISGGWKIRKGADWTVSAGGTYAKAGEAFEAVTDNGGNIAVTDMTRFDVVYDTVAGQITVSAPVK